MKFIINADDCGYSEEVNQAIDRCFEKQLITSTTIMANMNGFTGVQQLYKKWKDTKSFGIHLNLSEGTPLIKSSLLIEKGIYNEKDGDILFNRQTVKNKYLPSIVRKEIYKELKMQIEKVLDAGIIPSHIDGHHHIHTSPFILPIVLQLAKEYNINKIRRMGITPLHHGINKFVRSGWLTYAHIFNRDIKTTTYFCGYSDYINNKFKDRNKDKNVVCELMIHPGNIHPEDEILLNKTFPFESNELISYYE